MMKGGKLNWRDIFLSGKRAFYWIGVLVVLIYFQSLFFGFTYLDDNVLVLDNLFFLRNAGNFFKTFTQEVFHVLHSSASYYRPILTISFMIDSWFGGELPFFYHLTNVLIHLVNSLLVYWFLVKIKTREELAFIFALVFAVHPVLSQAVSWIPGRNDSLLVLFILPAFIFLTDYFETRKIKFLYWHLIFFGLSLFTKESSIFIPFLVILYLYLQFGLERLKKSLGVIIPSYFVLYMTWFFLRSIALANSPAPYGVGEAIKTIVSNSPAVILYLGKVFFPINLTVLPTLVDSSLIYGYIAILIIISLLAISRRRNFLVITFGLGWFLIFLLTSFIRPISVYAPDFLEHRLYLPIIGLFIILNQVSLPARMNLDNKVTLLAIGLLISFLGGINLYHSRVFADRLSFWRNAVKYSPSHPLSHKNLGAMYYLDGRFNEAKMEFEKAVQLNPGEQMIYNNLGLIAFQEGDYDQAVAYYQKELEINPGYDNAYFNWGLLLWTQGDKEEAASMWEKAVAVNPDHKDALKFLALYYTEVKNNLKARYFYTEAVRRGVEF